MIGIYYIRNIKNDKYYIGQSIDINRRFKQHKYYLYNNVHKNEHLQNSWNKYGEDFFLFGVIIQCSKDKLDFWEKYYIIFYNSLNAGYNYDSGGTHNYGWNHLESSIQKIKRANKGKKKSIEHRKKLSIAHKGKIIPPEVRKKMSLSSMGYKHSEETKKKISKANKGKTAVNYTFEDKVKKSICSNTTGYYRVTKCRDSTCIQGFLYMYQYYDEESKKRKKIRRVNIEKLKEAVIKKGLPWIKLEDYKK